MTLQISSTAFEHGQPIPKQHTGEGGDVSPPLAWSGVPEGAQSLALVCEDPDAPSSKKPAPQPWVHWVIYNIPPDSAGLPEGVPRQPSPASPAGARQGSNSWPSDNVGYRGPMPPPGSGRHRYIFRLYALDTALDFGAKTPDKQQLLTATKGHILNEAELTGVYERK